MKIWIVRIVLAVLTLEAGICVALLADDWKALRNTEESLFISVLRLVRDQEEFVLDEVQPVSRVRLVRPLQPGMVQSYFHVPVKDSLVASSTLVPEDWSILLTHVNEIGCKVAAIEQPLSWESQDEYDLARLRSLDRAIALYDTVVLTVDLQRVKNPQPIPEYLRRCAIPLGNVRGEVGSLVRVNRVIDPPSASYAPNVRFSYRVQESVEDVAPCFVRWDDYLIPSFPLAVAMAQHNVSPNEVRVDLGRYIRLGEGPIVRIDEIGEREVELIEKPQRAEFPADDLVLASELPAARRAAGENPPRCALFSDATATNPAPWPTPSNLQRIVSTFDILPRPSGLEKHQRLSLFNEILLLALVALVAALLVTFRGLYRFLGFGALALLLVALLAALFIQSQRWTPLAPVVATCAIGFFLSFRMARYLPSSPAPADS